MRSRVFSEALIAHKVNRLIDRFEYPDEIGGGGVVLGGGGGTPTIVVAASNASDLSKSKADLQCIGTNDEDPIEAASARAAAVGGRVLLTDGTFNADTISLDNNVSLIGMGRNATIINFTGTSGSIIEPGLYSTISDMFLDGNNASTQGIGTTDNDFVVIERVGFLQCGICINLTGDHWVIRDNIDAGSTYFIQDASLFVGTKVFGNWAVGALDMDAGTDWIIANNRLQNTILGDGCTRFVIANNVWSTGPSAVDDAVIDIANADYGLITGNQAENIGWIGVKLDTCSDILVADNQLDQCDDGIYLLDSSLMAVVGNHLKWSANHGIHLNGTSDSLIEGNHIYRPSQATTNTFDGIHLEGDSDRNDLWSNKIIGAGSGTQPRYGINISAATCNDDSYLGNRTGPAADYGTGTYNDAGTGTVNTWPGAAAPQGDNLL